MASLECLSPHLISGSRCGKHWSHLHVCTCAPPLPSQVPGGTTRCLASGLSGWPLRGSSWGGARAHLLLPSASLTAAGGQVVTVLSSSAQIPLPQPAPIFLGCSGTTSGRSEASTALQTQPPPPSALPTEFPSLEIWSWRSQVDQKKPRGCITDAAALGSLAVTLFLFLCPLPSNSSRFSSCLSTLTAPPFIMLHVSVSLPVFVDFSLPLFLFLPLPHSLSPSYSIIF